MVSLKGKLALFLFSLLMIFFLNACNLSVDGSAPGTYSIDPTFADFYEELGGEPVLGPAISPAFEKGGINYQYIVSGLMAYDPKAMTLSRFHFSPIASVEWGIHDVMEPIPFDPGIQYANGHSIWEEVSSLYDRYGSGIIGLPLTGVKANDEKQRYEQYFEGVGFYRDYSAPAGQVQLMPYGDWMCGENCQYRTSDKGPPSSSYIRDYSEIEQLFLKESGRLGYGFTGTPLVSPETAMDGYFEMVFENVVMYLDPVDGLQIKLRSLPSWLGIQVDPGTQETQAEGTSFYPMSDGLGHSIPDNFITYINEHGGMAYIGEPISAYRPLPGGGYSQCFTNLCLEFHPTAPEQLQIRPHALGIEYQTNGLAAGGTGSSISDALQINVSEDYPLIPSGQSQVINIEVSQNDVPVSEIKFSLLVKQPDGITKSYQTDPTGEGGRTSVELDPISGPNGSIVQYEVCVIAVVSPQVCFTRNYTIWNQ